MVVVQGSVQSGEGGNVVVPGVGPMRMDVIVASGLALELVGF